MGAHEASVPSPKIHFMKGSAAQVMTSLRVQVWWRLGGSSESRGLMGRALPRMGMMRVLRRQEALNPPCAGKATGA
jgi:hypothetical protein